MITTTGLTFQQVQSVFTQNIKSFFKDTKFLYKVDVSKDDMWNTYLESFPEEDGIRQSFNCNCCKSFIRKFGNVVKIVENKVVTIWDVTTGDEQMDVALKNLKELIELGTINNAFYPKETRYGTKSNIDTGDAHPGIEWHHFFCDVPSRLVQYTSSLRNNEEVSKAKGMYNSFWSSTRKISIESIKVVLDLIAQNSVPSGGTYKNSLERYLVAREAYQAFGDSTDKYNYVWEFSRKYPGAARVGGSAIGVLLRDITDGMPVDKAIRKFGSSVVSRETYMRSSSTRKIGKNAIQQAEEKLEELGLVESLDRRLASTEDVSINNAIWVNRTTKTLEGERKTGMSLLSDMKEEKIKVNPKQFDKVEEVPIAQFLEDIVPTCQKIEVLFQNDLQEHLVSLISPSNLDAPALTKWDNGFTWSYKGGYADAIKERVKLAGGNVDGVVGHRLVWFNTDDLDAHLIEPSGNEIDFSNKLNRSTRGQLDVDMNAGGRLSITPVENITYPNVNLMQEGEYHFFVYQFSKRNITDFGFQAEIECKVSGKTYQFSYDQLIKSNERVTVAKYKFSRENGIEIISSLPLSSPDAPKWNLQPNKFQEATMIMKSPNFWEGQGVGDEHIFIMLKDAQNQDSLIRGFFNEQLSSDLLPHRRVFEALADRLKVDPAPSKNQLTGLGFQLTKKSSFVVRVTGSVTRTLKVTV